MNYKITENNQMTFATSSSLNVSVQTRLGDMTMWKQRT